MVIPTEDWFRAVTVEVEVEYQVVKEEKGHPAVLVTNELGHRAVRIDVLFGAMVTDVRYSAMVVTVMRRGEWVPYRVRGGRAPGGGDKGHVPGRYHGDSG